MIHALFQVDYTAICVGSACTQPSYNDKTLLISLYVFPSLKLSRLTVWRHTIESEKRLIGHCEDWFWICRVIHSCLAVNTDLL